MGRCEQVNVDCVRVHLCAHVKARVCMCPKPALSYFSSLDQRDLSMPEHFLPFQQASSSAEENS
jgi:hypothetical protein